jgi:hypothetical protein
METVLAIAIVVAAAGGLAVGLLLKGKPPETSCGGLACVTGARCEGCPRNVNDRGEVADGR